jgi:hypothetical protein
MQTIFIVLGVISATVAAVSLILKIHQYRASARKEKEKRQEKETTALSVSLKRTHSGEKFIVSNDGGGLARHVEFSLTPLEGRSSPLCSDYKETFPIKSLSPGDSVSVIAALSFETDVRFDYLLMWENSDKTQGVREGVVSLND